MGFFDRFFSKEKESELNKGLEKTKTGFLDKITKAVAGKSTIDEEILDDLEQILVTSDVGLDTTIKIIDRIEDRVAKDKYLNASELSEILRDEITLLLSENNTEDLEDYDCGPTLPHVILVVGVNGVGKTTSIGKLAYQYSLKGKKVMIAAGDTFRAAAEDQLKIWSERVGCDFFTKGMGADPSAVAYEATQLAIQNKTDVLIIDTAGRLHTKINLMTELSKIQRSIGKSMPGAPHEVLLILDATTGQNAIEQCRQFTNTAHVTGLILTKLDGTAKGGVAIGISDQFKIPIKYIGIGEGIGHLQVFNRRAFIDSLFEKANSKI
ncbi:MAG: signal recognition particle-docking protein FtsY [Saprospiraceae bacterium]|jgi:fused signal recognition particle receptor|nr:signal recognition particle-docking protein FtsY [Saprospiraceae bacterium]MBK7797198.1 signal recognition particle-docking protein FtsY [Saprospiraceae bacterium]MBL0261717.1 signal recognition particle-docking protein FtsY [Saprospiraceae bacterium]MBX7162877.1 signal recognition particle-docking protein FtsY [Saprospiraceae bacterium]